MAKQVYPTSNYLIPFVIGICGELRSEIEEELARTMIRALWDLLDRLYPASPKILLSTLSSAFARIAADEAILRPGWRVAAPTPCPQEQFLARIDTDAHRLWWKWFVTRQGVHTYQLAPLAGASASPEDDWTANLEQANLYVAGHSHLFIRLKSTSNSIEDASGERAANYKLSATVDATARAIVSRSDLLFNPSTLDDMGRGAVWQIDSLARAQHVDRHLLSAVSVLSPGPSDSKAKGDLRFDQSIPLAERIEEYNRDFENLYRRRYLQFSDVNSSVRDASSVLQSFSDGLSAAQHYHQRYMHWTVWTLPIFFLCSALAFECWFVRAVIPPGQIGISIYAFFMFLAMGLYWFSVSRRWQSRAEEYRAVVEALRVQAAWWNYGLTGCTYRVDHYYLNGARGPFRLVRYAIHGLINAATIMAGFAAPDPTSHLAWIESQIDFFESRVASRKWLLRRAEWISASALAVGLFVATFVLALETVDDYAAGSLPNNDKVVASALPLSPLKNAGPMSAHHPATLPCPDPTNMVNNPQSVPKLDLSTLLVSLENLQPGAKIIIALLAATLIAAIAAWLWNRAVNGARVPILDAAIAILIIGIVLGLGVVDFLKLMETHWIWAQHHDKQLLKWGGGSRPWFDFFGAIATLSAAVVASSRYVSEKLSWRAELHSYEETLEIFNRAMTEIEAVELSERPQAERDARYREIIVALGKQALAENERWLRAHRERPLEPVFST